MSGVCGVYVWCVYVCVCVCGVCVYVCVVWVCVGVCGDNRICLQSAFICKQTVNSYSRSIYCDSSQFCTAVSIFTSLINLYSDSCKQ